jgi:hypothetical protein
MFATIWELQRVFLKKTKLWPESASELYQPSDSRLSAKLVPIFADRGCHVYMHSMNSKYQLITKLSL